MEIIVKSIFDAEPWQEVGYNKETLSIVVEDWLASVDDVIELAEVVRDQLLEVAGRMINEEKYVKRYLMILRE